MQEMTAQAAAQALLENPNTTVLLDVRESVELQQAAVPGAQHIPMGSIPERLDELDKSKTILCLCHLGGRSAQVAQFLSTQGFPHVINVAGGMEAWIEDVDPSVVKAL